MQDQKKVVASVSEKLGGVMGASGHGLTLRPFASLAHAVTQSMQLSTNQGDIHCTLHIQSPNQSTCTCVHVIHL